MLRQTIATPTLGTVTQNYSYADGFNRLTNAAETAQGQQSWQQTFQYDNYGNKALTSGYTQYPALAPGSLSQFNGNNQWTGAGYTGGNMTSLPQQSFTYDGENRITASTQPGTPSISYVYDGEGKRVQKAVGSSVTTCVYDASSELVAEYGTPTDSGTTYVSVDHLGSTRLLQRSSGTNYYDYLPFGEDLPAGVGGRNSSYASGVYPASGPDFVPIKFTGKERDAESGLDYFGARYLSSAQRRFTSPDWSETPQPVPYADLTDPQTLNLYSYVRNNPLSKADSTGHCFWDLCIGEGAAAYAIGGAAIATAAYLVSPQGQKSVQATVQGLGLLINKGVDAVSSLLPGTSTEPQQTSGTPGTLVETMSLRGLQARLLRRRLVFKGQPKREGPITPLGVTFPGTRLVTIYQTPMLKDPTRSSARDKGVMDSLTLRVPRSTKTVISKAEPTLRTMVELTMTIPISIRRQVRTASVLNSPSSHRINNDGNTR